jgi:membrane associated rhomboid family serine protease
VLLLIPLGADSHESRLPRATIVLIALNVLVFLFTSGADVTKATAEQEELERIAEHTLRGLPPAVQERASGHSSALAFLDTDNEWPSEVQSSRDRERIEACLEGYRALKDRHPFHRFGFAPAEIGPLRLISHQFLHGDLIHLLFNMLFLWGVGGLLEQTLGAPLFVSSYLVSGVAAALAHAVAHPGSAEPAIGASGAVAGLMGMFTVLHLRQPLRLALVAGLGLAPRILILSLPAWVFLGLWLLEQLFFASFGSSVLGVAFLAHLGGFAFGVALALLLRNRGWAAGASRPARHGPRDAR